MNTQSKENRFDDFFKEQQYVALKNDLYNYRLRKSAVSRYLLHTQKSRVIIEIGCGISPVSSHTNRTVFTDLSFRALVVLKRVQNYGDYVVADGCHLPFKSGVFSHAISSEVLEHIPDDRPAMAEMARVVMRSGKLVITVPHRKCYYARDDRYVGHFRRYEIGEMETRFKRNGFQIEKIEKVLGPLEKITMITAVILYERLQKRLRQRSPKAPAYLECHVQKLFHLANTLFMVPVWMEARIMPVSFATVLMIIGSHSCIQVPEYVEYGSLSS
jgi:ubiquinone/menaquinone biosynthesis C-methylase UbiE